MGLSYESVVETDETLRGRVRYLLETYEQPVLVEQFVEGREFTVPIIGNSPPPGAARCRGVVRGDRARLPSFSLMIPSFGCWHVREDRRIISADDIRLSDDRRCALLQTDVETELAVPVSLTKSVCPADVPRSLAEALQKTALEAYRVL